MSDRFIAGPWVAVGSTVYSEREGEPCPVCTTDGFVERFKSDEIPCEQLALLIAAAPELLEALEHMVAVSNWATTIQSEEQYDAMIANAEAAIRKAKGE